MTEALHRDIQPLRRNVYEVIGRLREAKVFFSLNHLLHFYRQQVPLDSYLRLIAEVPALEERNGTMVAAHNDLVERLIVHLRHTSSGPGGQWPGITAGSDAHTLRRIGRTWTEAPGRTTAEFLGSLRAGLGRSGGVHGGTVAVAGDAYGVVARYCASLFGFWPSNHAPLHRAGCIAFSIVSLPGQFLPWMIPAFGKRRERRIVSAVAAELEPLLTGNAPRRGWFNVAEEEA